MAYNDSVKIFSIMNNNAINGHFGRELTLSSPKTATRTKRQGRPSDAPEGLFYEVIDVVI